MIYPLPLLPKNEDTQPVNEIGREKLANLWNFANTLKHPLAKLWLGREALHHGGEELRRAIRRLRCEAHHHNHKEKQ